MQRQRQPTAYTDAIRHALETAGIGEREPVRFVDEAHRTLGADDGPTFCFAQFGKATAYPHGLPDGQCLGASELVRVDPG